MLIYGPYEPPKCKVGSTLYDLRFGKVVVTSKQDGWPLCEKPLRPGPNPNVEVPVLTGSLIEAVTKESIKAIAEHWKVPNHIVRRWREAVAGTTTEVSTALALLRYDPAFMEKHFR